MSFNKTEQFFDLALRTAAPRHGITFGGVADHYEVSLQTGLLIFP